MQVQNSMVCSDGKHWLIVICHYANASPAEYPVDEKDDGRHGHLEAKRHWASARKP